MLSDIGALFPFVNYDTFSFPIYPARRDGGRMTTGDVPINPYVDPFFEPPWFPRIGNETTGWTALNVPEPAGPFRPGGPEDTDADGNVILYDEQTKTEYDFWQVTTQTDPFNKTLGGGRVGPKIVRAGNITGFRADGLGTRRFEVDPQASARATGLPYLGGLLLPEDLAHGAASKINHALIFALPKLRYSDTPPLGIPNWVYPASHTESSDKLTSQPRWLAAGQRIALNADYLYGRAGLRLRTDEVLNDPHLPPIVRIFLEALMTHGAFLVDRGHGFGLAAEDIHTANYARIVPHDTDAKVKDLTLLNPDPAQTPWEFLIGTLNDHLGGLLSSGQRTPLLDGSGLSFAYLDDKGFRSNFTVVEDLFGPN